MSSRDIKAEQPSDSQDMQQTFSDPSTVNMSSSRASNYGDPPVSSDGGVSQPTGNPGHPRGHGPASPGYRQMQPSSSGEHLQGQASVRVPAYQLRPDRYLPARQNLPIAVQQGRSGTVADGEYTRIQDEHPHIRQLQLQQKAVALGYAGPTNTVTSDTVANLSRAYQLGQQSQQKLQTAAAAGYPRPGPIYDSNNNNAPPAPVHPRPLPTRARLLGHNSWSSYLLAEHENLKAAGHSVPYAEEPGFLSDILKNSDDIAKNTAGIATNAQVVDMLLGRVEKLEDNADEENKPLITESLLRRVNALESASQAAIQGAVDPQVLAAILKRIDTLEATQRVLQSIESTTQSDNPGIISSRLSVPEATATIRGGGSSKSEKAQGKAKECITAMPFGASIKRRHNENGDMDASEAHGTRDSGSRISGNVGNNSMVPTSKKQKIRASIEEDPDSIAPSSRSGGADLIGFLKKMDCRNTVHFLRLDKFLTRPDPMEFGLFDHEDELRRVHYFLKCGGDPRRRTPLWPASRDRFDVPQTRQSKEEIDQATASRVMECILLGVKKEEGPGGGDGSNNDDDDDDNGGRPAMPRYVVALGEVLAVTRDKTSRAVPDRVSSTNFHVVMDVTGAAKALWLVHKGEEIDAGGAAAPEKGEFKVQHAQNPFQGAKVVFDAARVLPDVGGWAGRSTNMVRDDWVRAVRETARKVSPAFVKPVFKEMQEMIEEGWKP